MTTATLCLSAAALVCTAFGCSGERPASNAPEPSSAGTPAGSAAAAAALPSPRSLAGAAVNSTMIGLAWEDHSTDEAGFRIERRTGSDAFEEIGRIPADQVRFTDDRAKPGSKYSYRVCAFNDRGDSAFSNVVAVETPMQSSNAISPFR